MAAAVGIIAGIAAIAGTGYQAIHANQVSQDAKGAAGEALRNAPSPTLEAAKANEAGLAARTKAQKQAAGLTGFDGTLLNGPSGIASQIATGKGTHTLLGG